MMTGILRSVTFSVVIVLSLLVFSSFASAQGLPTPVPQATFVPLPPTVDGKVPANSGAGITELLKTVSDAADQWAKRGKAIALRLFWLLVTIDLAYLGIEWALKSNDISDFVGKLLTKIMAVGFFLAIIENATTWIPDIINGFICAGIQIGSVSAACPSGGVGATFAITAIDPGKTFELGITLASGMISSENLLQIITSPSGIPTGILSGLCAMLIVVGFAIIAAQLLVALVEAYFVFGAGLVMLGFTGSRWTVSFGEKYIGYAVSMGVKLMTLVLVVSLGNAIVTKVSTLVGLTYTSSAGQLLSGAIAGTPANATIPVYLTMVGLIGIFLYAAWHIPQSAATLLNGSPTMSLAGVANAASAAVFGAAGMAAGVAGAGLSAAGAIGGGGLAKSLSSVADRGDAGDSDASHLGMATPSGSAGGGGAGSMFGEASTSSRSPMLALAGGGGGRDGGGFSGGPSGGGPSGGGPSGGGPNGGGPNGGGPSGGGPSSGGPSRGGFSGGPSGGGPSSGSFDRGSSSTQSSNSDAPWDAFASNTPGASPHTAPSAMDDVVDAQFREIKDEGGVKAAFATVEASAGDIASAIAEAMKPKPQSDMDKAKQFLKRVQSARKPTFLHDGGAVGAAPIKMSH